MAEQEPKQPAYPYTSFRTILNLAQRMESEKAVPPRIDRTFLTGSEGSKTQVIAAMKFLGLIAANGDVLPPLNDLALSPSERPRLVGELLKRCYPDQLRLATL